MISATVLGIFFVPLFYLWVKRLFSRSPRASGLATGPAAEVQ
jgi:hypothetical protein